MGTHRSSSSPLPLQYRRSDADQQRVLDAAIEYAAAGLNPLPLKPITKFPFGPWKMAEYAFLKNEGKERVLEDIFLESGPADIAVMCGSISKYLFVIDADSIQARDFIDGMLVERSFEERSIFPWTRSSPRGRQYWFRCIEGEVISRKSLRLNIPGAKLDILGSGYVVAPPSIDEKTGEERYWERRLSPTPPSVSIREFDFLGLKIQSYRPVTRSIEHLPPKAHAVLVLRDTTGYETNSEAEFAACRSLLGVGCTEDEILAQFRIHNPPHFAKKGETRFRKSVLNPAVLSRNQGQGVDPIVTDAKKILSGLNDLPFPGQCGSSDKGVLRALLERVIKEKSWCVRGSQRELSELFSGRHETVRKALKRLQEPDSSGEALISLARQGNGGGRPSMWLVHRKPLENCINRIKNTTTSLSTCPSIPEIPLGHDAFHRNALGRSGHECLSWLVSHPQGGTTSEIARGLGKRNPSTPHRALEKLEEVSLVRRNEKIWYADRWDLAALNEAAFHFGTFGKKSEKQARYQRERTILWASKLREQKARHYQNMRRSTREKVSKWSIGEPSWSGALVDFGNPIRPHALEHHQLDRGLGIPTTVNPNRRMSIQPIPLAISRRVKPVAPLTHKNTSVF